MSRIVIGVTGFKHAGKSSIAKYLSRRFGFARMRFAHPMKEMLRAFLRARGCPEDVIEEMIEGSLKEVPSPYLNGRTPRHAMQTLGTEWGRDQMHEDLWLDAWGDSLSTIPPDCPVVVDDCRFENEFDRIRQLNGQIWRVVRPLNRAQKNDLHASEINQVELVADEVIVNNNTMAQLFVRVDAAFHRLTTKPTPTTETIKVIVHGN